MRECALEEEDPHRDDLGLGEDVSAGRRRQISHIQPDTRVWVWVARADSISPLTLFGERDESSGSGRVGMSTRASRA